MTEIVINDVPLDIAAGQPTREHVEKMEREAAGIPDPGEAQAVPEPLPERDGRLRLKDRVTESRDREIPEIDPSLDPRMAIADKANRDRRARLLAENLADPALAEMTLALSDESGYEPAPLPEPEPKTVQLKVFNQVLDVNADDVERMGGPVEAQKQLAAEAKFRQAADERREAERILAEAEARLNATRLLDAELTRKLHPNAGAPTPAPALPAQADAAVDTKKLAQDIVTSIFAGDMDSAAKALDEVLKPRQQPIDLAPVVDQVLVERQQRDQQARQQEQARIAKESVNELMRSKHSDILADPILKAGTMAAFNEMRANPANASFSLAEIADAAAQNVKARFQPQPQPQPQPSPMAERERVKAGMSWQPGARSASRQEPAPMTRSSVVQQMREARGLPN